METMKTLVSVVHDLEKSAYGGPHNPIIYQNISEKWDLLLDHSFLAVRFSLFVASQESPWWLLSVCCRKMWGHLLVSFCTVFLTLLYA